MIKEGCKVAKFHRKYRIDFNSVAKNQWEKLVEEHEWKLRLAQEVIDAGYIPSEIIRMNYRNEPSMTVVCMGAYVGKRFVKEYSKPIRVNYGDTIKIPLNGTPRP
jgi:hypothetical protein